VKFAVDFPNREFVLFETDEWKGNDIVFTITFKSAQFKNKSRPIQPVLSVKTSVCKVNVGAVDGNERNIAPPLPGSVVLHEQDVNVEFFNVTCLPVVAAIDTAPPFSLFVAFPDDTLTFSNAILCVELVDVDENTLD
jgi:hypothetical protein